MSQSRQLVRERQARVVPEAHLAGALCKNRCRPAAEVIFCEEFSAAISSGDAARISFSRKSEGKRSKERRAFSSEALLPPDRKILATGARVRRAATRLSFPGRSIARAPGTAQE